MAFKAPRITTIDKFEEAIAFGMAVRTMGRIKYPQAREYVNKQRDVNAPFHSNIHDISSDCYNSGLAQCIGDVLLDHYNLL